jgi:hypothetical protein
MVQAHPWLGLGFDGFRDNCNDPRYFRLLPWLPVTEIGAADGCTIHPHNYWLQIATSSGLPGLALFSALCGVWLARIGRGAVHRPERRVAVPADRMGPRRASPWPNRRRARPVTAAEFHVRPATRFTAPFIGC